MSHINPVHAPPAEIEGDNIPRLSADNGRDQLAASEAGGGGGGGGGGEGYCILEIYK